MMAWLTRLLRGPAPPPESPAPPATRQTCPSPKDSPAEQRLAAASRHATSKIEEADAATRQAFAVVSQRSPDIAEVMRLARQRHGCREC